MQTYSLPMEVNTYDDLTAAVSEATTEVELAWWLWNLDGSMSLVAGLYCSSYRAVVIVASGAPSRMGSIKYIRG